MFDLDKHFKLKKPCPNCPFLKEGAIELHPDRLPSIIEDLIKDDHSTFHCHKTVHNERTGGDWSEDGEYASSGRESMCAGAMIYLEKVGRPTVGMRLGRSLKVYDPELLKPSFDAVIDPPVSPQNDTTD